MGRLRKSSATAMVVVKKGAGKGAGKGFGKEALTAIAKKCKADAVKKGRASALQRQAEVKKSIKDKEYKEPDACSDDGEDAGDEEPLADLRELARITREGLDVAALPTSSSGPSSSSQQKRSKVSLTRRNSGSAAGSGQHDGIPTATELAEFRAFKRQKSASEDGSGTIPLSALPQLLQAMLQGQVINPAKPKKKRRSKKQRKGKVRKFVWVTKNSIQTNCSRMAADIMEANYADISKDVYANDSDQKDLCHIALKVKDSEQRAFDHAYSQSGPNSLRSQFKRAVMVKRSKVVACIRTAFQDSASEQHDLPPPRAEGAEEHDEEADARQAKRSAKLAELSEDETSWRSSGDDPMGNEILLKVISKVFMNMAKLNLEWPVVCSTAQLVFTLLVIRRMLKGQGLGPDSSVQAAEFHKYRTEVMR